MKYLELTIHTTSEASELVAELASEEGAQGVSIIDRSDLDERGEYAKWDSVDDEFISSMPEDVVVKAVFSADRPEEARGAMVRMGALAAEDVGYPVGTLEMSLDEHDDAEWADAWKAYFKPFKVGRRLVVKPSWEEYEAVQDELVLELDPGMAFGTGTHETTSLCLELLEDSVSGGESVLDVGCGSGILAVAAMKLGASRALAVDFDPDAVSVAQENVRRNGLEGCVLTRVGDLLENLRDDEETAAYGENGCEVLLANILADVIIRLMPSARKALKADGVMIASGIIKDRAEDVKREMAAYGFAVTDERRSGEWVAIAARKGAAA